VPEHLFFHPSENADFTIKIREILKTEPAMRFVDM